MEKKINYSILNEENNNFSIINKILEGSQIMRKAMILIFTVILALSACSTSENIVFTAIIESVMENSILVTTITTTDSDVGFDRASVSFDENTSIPFNLIPGQTVELTILPEIRESYPVQVVAVKIQLADRGSGVEYKKITGEEAAQLMTEDVIVLDVRSEAEYDEGYIRDAVLLPDNEVRDRAESVLPDKSQTILVYCRSGRRSEAAAKILIEMGYTAVYDFGGITTDWNGEVVKPSD